MQRNEDKDNGEEGQAGGEDVIFRHEDCGVSPQNKCACTHTHTLTNVNTTRGVPLSARYCLATWQTWKPTRPQTRYSNTKHTRQDSNTGAWLHAQTPLCNLSAAKRRRQNETNWRVRSRSQQGHHTLSHPLVPKQELLPAWGWMILQSDANASIVIEEHTSQVGTQTQKHTGGHARLVWRFGSLLDKRVCWRQKSLVQVVKLPQG